MSGFPTLSGFRTRNLGVAFVKVGEAKFASVVSASSRVKKPVAGHAAFTKCIIIGDLTEDVDRLRSLLYRFQLVGGERLVHGNRERVAPGRRYDGMVVRHRGNTPINLKRVIVNRERCRR